MCAVWCGVCVCARVYVSGRAPHLGGDPQCVCQAVAKGARHAQPWAIDGLVPHTGRAQGLVPGLVAGDASLGCGKQQGMRSRASEWASECAEHARTPWLDGG